MLPATTIAHPAASQSRRKVESWPATRSAVPKTRPSPCSSSKSAKGRNAKGATHAAYTRGASKMTTYFRSSIDSVWTAPSNGAMPAKIDRSAPRRPARAAAPA